MRRHRGDWLCPLCNVVIFSDRCKKCKIPKLKPGDWVCRRAPCVSVLNFATRSMCCACTQPKPVVCVCSEPQFAHISVNGDYEKLGYCERCLCPNPTPWYVTILDALEAKMTAPREHWRYRLSACGRHPTHNVTGLGELVPMHANVWLFNSREDVEAELKEHTDIPGLRVGSV